jgi:hypothetical protein
MNLDLVHRFGDGDGFIAIGIVDQNHQIHDDCAMSSSQIMRNVRAALISSCPKLVTLCAVK